MSAKIATAKKGSKKVVSKKSNKKATKRKITTNRKQKTRKIHHTSKAQTRRSSKKGPKQPKKTNKAAKLSKKAELAVKLGVHVLDGVDSEAKKVEISGKVRLPRSRDVKNSPGIKEREIIARQVSRGVRPDRLTRLLAAVAHPQRLSILLKLLSGEATHKLLAKATGLKAGPLYYHLRELREAEMIGPRVRDLYVLTKQGKRVILSVIAMERLCRQ